MSIIRIILWMIVVFIAAKIAGSVLRYVRKIISPPRVAAGNTDRGPESYHNVEDVPYEEVTEKK